MSTGQTIRAYDRIADRIRLHRQSDASPVVVVEGPSDAKLIARSFPHRWTLFPAGGRTNALETVETLHEWKTKAVICVVDRDFDDTVARHESQGLPVLAYENADIEAMLSCGPAYRDLLGELASAVKLDAHGGASSIIRHIHKAVLPITTLRRVNFEQGWGLKFDEVDVASKVDQKTLALKVQSYCAALSSTVSNDPSQKILIEYATGQREPQRSSVCPRGSQPYYRGRDFLAVAGVALRNLIGNCSKGATEAEHLSKIIRLAGAAHLYHSEWGEEMCSMMETVG